MAEKLSEAVAALETELAYWREQAEQSQAMVRVYEVRAKSHRNATLPRETGPWHVEFAAEEAGNMGQPAGMVMEDPRVFLYGLIDHFASRPGPISIEVRRPSMEREPA